MKVDWLIVGAGYTGCILAERLATQLNRKVLLVDRRDHVGGNAFDFYNEHGVLVHQYGPHIFHTNSKKVWDYLSQFTDWRPYYHHVLAVVEGRKVPVPFNLNSINKLFPAAYAERLEKALIDGYPYGTRVPVLKLMESENAELRTLAKYVYDNVFFKYTTKQWELKPEELDRSVTARVPLAVSRDDRYFQDTYQAMPTLGYSAMFKRMLAHPNIHVLLKADYKDIAGEVKYDRMAYSGAVDSFFDYTHGPLPYRSLRFEFQTLDQEWFQETGTVNYPNEYDFTRITEQKRLTGQTLPKTTITVEYPQRYEIGVNDPYYPIPRDENRVIHERYLGEVRKMQGKVLFAGRLADYRYYNMDQAAARALKLFEDEMQPKHAPVFSEHMQHA